MLLIDKLSCIAAAIGLATLSSGIQAADSSCDRDCLRSLADGLVASLISHSPAAVPLSSQYAATEDGQPAALPMMTLWRTVTGAKGKYYVIDPKSGQMFLIVTLSEGPNDTLLFARLKAEGARLSEIELYTNRSRGDGGFQFDATGPSHFPNAWTARLEPKQHASRADLLHAGQSIFNTSLEGLPAAPACVLMENGKIVGEDPDVLKSIMGPAMDTAKLQRNPDGTVAIPCGASPDRPTDKDARTDILDEEQGIVVSMGTVHGMVEPYLITSPTDSAFVPISMLSSYADMLKKQQASGKYKASALRPMPATQQCAVLYRIYDGRLQGMMMLQNTAAVGATSPWVPVPAPPTDR